MAQYRVLEKSYIGNTIVEEGDIVEFGGRPGHNLELIGDEATAQAEAPAGEAKPQKGFARKAAKSADAN